jgi:hypothetical protein
MLINPILLGLLVAPSLAGLFLVLMVVPAFLARTPLKVIWKDRQRGRHYARTSAANKVLALYSLLFALGLAAVIYTGGLLPLLPLLLVLPLAVLTIYFDLASEGRRLLAELIAPVALSAIVAAMALAGGWDYAHALALWAIPLMHALPAVLYVRARLRLDREQPAGITGSIAIHVLALALAVALVWAGLIPILAAAAVLVLLGRAAYGLSPYRRPMSVKQLGWSEVFFGFLTVLLAAIGYWTSGIG